MLVVVGISKGFYDGNGVKWLETWVVMFSIIMSDVKVIVVKRPRVRVIEV